MASRLHQTKFFFCKLPPPAGVVYHFNLQPQCFLAILQFQRTHRKVYACLHIGKWGNQAKFYLITYAQFDSIVSNSIYQECLMNMDIKFSIYS